MDQIALRVTLTLLKNLSRKQIRLPSNMVDRTKEQLIMNIDPYVRVTEVRISFRFRNTYKFNSLEVRAVVQWENARFPDVRR